MRSKTLDKVALTEEVSSTVDRSVAAQVQVGDKGYAVTRLALIGNAEINGHVVEVRSADGFLNEKTPVVVTCVTDNEIIVQKIKNS
jgi:membrane-bound ClpP family serine protease